LWKSLAVYVDVGIEISVVKRYFRIPSFIAMDDVLFFMASEAYKEARRLDLLFGVQSFAIIHTCVI
ncbi:hypothetical protein HAX54_035650, partial [Datura stramonium]|nr:hypothetical protein [Datura stramonium]